MPVPDPARASAPELAISSTACPPILLLGGTGDAVAIARQLRPDDCYSVAGLGHLPDDLPCRVREGGFGGVAGLVDALLTGGYGLLLDATHPYAAQISANAVAAATRCGLPYWRMERPAWAAASTDRWIEVDDWAQTLDAVSRFRRPLWTLGREPLAHTHSATSGQHWFVRCLPQTAARHAHGGEATTEQSCITVIPARGPFTLASERALIASLGIDVIVSKNSGGAATDAKLQVARECGLPVIMRRRPRAAWGQVEIDESRDAREAAGTAVRLFDSALSVVQALSLFNVNDKA